MPKQLELFPDEEPKEEVPKVDLNPLFDRLSKSKFRSSFYLNAKDKSIFVRRVGTRLNRAQERLLSKDWLRLTFRMTASRLQCGTAYFLHSLPNTLQAVAAGTVYRNGTG